jgi:ribosomal-protein-alanine N-acetyltransferase
MLSPEDMARISRAAYHDGDATCTADQFANLLAMPNIFAILRPEGYLIFRVAGLEADIHSFTIAPEARARGIGTGMLLEGLENLRDRGVREVFLEVDTDNLPALKLYTRTGFFVVGDRPAYYKRGDGSWADAYSMAYYYGKEDRIGAVGRYRLSV